MYVWCADVIRGKQQAIVPLGISSHVLMTKVFTYVNTYNQMRKIIVLFSRNSAEIHFLNFQQKTKMLCGDSDSLCIHASHMYRLFLYLNTSELPPPTTKTIISFSSSTMALFNKILYTILNLSVSTYKSLNCNKYY